MSVPRSSLELICSECFEVTGPANADFQRFNIFAFNLLKQVILCPEYRPPKHEHGEEVIISRDYP